MIGLIALAIVIGYLTLSVVLACCARWLAKTSLGKWVNSCLVVLVMFLIPTWDIPIAKSNFKRYCENEAGIVVHKRVGLSDDYYIKAGTLVRKAIHHKNGAISNPEVPATGDELDITKIKAEFIVEDRVDRNITPWGHFDRYTTKIKQEREVLGSAVSITYGGGWLKHQISLSGAANGPCPVRSEGMNIHDVYIYDK